MYYTIEAYMFKAVRYLTGLPVDYFCIAHNIKKPVVKELEQNGTYLIDAYEYINYKIYDKYASILKIPTREFELIMLSADTIIRSIVFEKIQNKEIDLPYEEFDQKYKNIGIRLINMVKDIHNSRNLTNYVTHLFNPYFLAQKSKDKIDFTLGNYNLSLNYPNIFVSPNGYVLAYTLKDIKSNKVDLYKPVKIAKINTDKIWLFKETCKRYPYEFLIRKNPLKPVDIDEFIYNKLEKLV